MIRAPLVGKKPGKSLGGTCSQKTLPSLSFWQSKKEIFRQLPLPFAFVFAIIHQKSQKVPLEGTKSCDFDFYIATGRKNGEQVPCLVGKKLRKSLVGTCSPKTLPACNKRAT